MSKMKDSKRGKGDRRTINDGRLIIDCGGCKGTSSLSDGQCLVCICNELSGMGNVSSLVLRSSMDVAVDSDAICAIRELSFVRNFMVGNRSERKGRKCDRCKRSFTALVKDQVASFPDVDFPLLRDRMSQMQFPDQVCALCAGDTIRLLDTMEATLSDVGITDSKVRKGVA